jgi:hypothetical protein
VWVRFVLPGLYDCQWTRAATLWHSAKHWCQSLYLDPSAGGTRGCRLIWVQAACLFADDRKSKEHLSPRSTCTVLWFYQRQNTLVLFVTNNEHVSYRWTPNQAATYWSNLTMHFLFIYHYAHCGQLCHSVQFYLCQLLHTFLCSYCFSYMFRLVLPTIIRELTSRSPLYLWLRMQRVYVLPFQNRLHAAWTYGC